MWKFEKMRHHKINAERSSNSVHGSSSSDQHPKWRDSCPKDLEKGPQPFPCSRTSAAPDRTMASSAYAHGFPCESRFTGMQTSVEEGRNFELSQNGH